MALIWTGTHPYRDHANDRTIEPGEEIPEDCADRIAASHARSVEEREADDADGDELAEAEAAETGFSEDDWLAGDYDERAEAVEDGRVDEFLDAIEDCETSENVIEAVEARRDELAEE